MPSKNILIVDEDRFSRICEAILSEEGYGTKLAVSFEEATSEIDKNGISLIISSYPFAAHVLKSGILKDIPVVILSDELNNDLINLVRGLNNAICMLKPLDFDRFRFIIKGLMNGYINVSGGNIIA
jgi:DNA-binding response OmpR family regulator